MNVEKTIETLKKNGFKVSFFENKEAAADYIVGELSGKTIGIGGSKTVEALGVYERLMECTLSSTRFRVPSGNNATASSFLR